jgi:hypothetical protein
MKVKVIFILIALTLISCKTTEKVDSQVLFEPGYYSMGNVGFNNSIISMDQILDIAKSWAKNNNFKSIVIRKVDDINFGIQFIYFSNTENNDIQNFTNEILNKYGKETFVQFDYQFNINITEDNIDNFIIKY